MRVSLWILAACLGAAATGSPAAKAEPASDKAEYRRPLTIPFPDRAPYSPQVATLGKMLYFDPRLSGAQNMSCASCHNPSFGWEVPVDGAVGAANTKLGRQAPTILNVAWVPHFFWDGRAATLEHQAAGPIGADVEMNGNFDDIVERLSEVPEYEAWFERLFPEQGLSESAILTSIATYERTVVAGWAPFDRWVDGDETALSASAKRGFDLFVGRANCDACHTGWNFTDNKFHDTGLPTEDIGRAKYEPENPKAMHAFKTPGLRNVLYRAPYMHNGMLENIEELLTHYAGGGIERPSRAAEIIPFDMSDQDLADLTAFLGSLTADEAEVPTPILPTK